MLKAVEWYTKAANQSYNLGQFLSGTDYANGKGVPIDPYTSAEILRGLMQQGTVEAQYNLGVIYLGRQGIAQDYHAARYWYSKAAMQGFAPAQYSLGILYRNGLGVQQNYIAAYFWFSLATATASPSSDTYAQASHAISILTSNMTPVQITEARHHLKEWTKMREK